MRQRGGTQQQAIDYCKKGEQSHDEWTELGTAGPNYGKNADVTFFGNPKAYKAPSVDLDEFKAKVLKHSSNSQLIDEFGMAPVNRFQKLTDRMKIENKPEWENKREVILIVGEPGCGKTRYVADNFPDYYTPPLQKDFKWFDGYCGQDTILLDEFEGNMPLSLLLQVLDIYLRAVEIKGGSVWMTAKRIFVTSNTHPSKWYNWTGNELYENRQNKEVALKRRFTSFIAWTKNGLAKVDPDKYWPVQERFIDRSLWECYEPLIESVNDLIREPVNEMEVEDIIIPRKDIDDEGYPIYFK